MQVRTVERICEAPPAPMPFPGRERRRQAQAYADWCDRAAGRSMPRWTAGTTAKGVSILPLAEPRADAVATGGALARALRAAAGTIAAAQAPLAFELALPEDEPGLARGLLLPLCDDAGRVVAVEVVSETVHGDGRDGCGDAAAVAIVAGSVAPGPVAPPCPWSRRPAGETHAAVPPPTWEERLLAARTWGALAARRPVRQAAWHAALGAAFDLLLAERAQGSPGQASTGDAADPASAALLLVFGAALPADAVAMGERVLAHAVRLRLGAGQLAPLLDRIPGGAAAMAALDADAPTVPDPLGLVLSPLDGGALLALARRTTDGRARLLRVA